MTGLRMRMRGIEAAPPSETEGGTAYALPPTLAPAELIRTPLVAPGDDVIDLQRDVAVPWSPTATNWTLSGPDASYFTITGGKMAFAAARRGEVPRRVLNLTLQASNPHGTSDTVTVKVTVPADANCRFFSPEIGNDANVGDMPSAPKKYLPGTPIYTGPATTYGAGVVCFLRGGEHHRYTIAKAKATFWPALDHAGTSFQARFTITGAGYGPTRAILDGSDVVSGLEAVTSAEVFGNPHAANIRKIVLATRGGPLLNLQSVFVDDEFAFRAMVPAPTNPFLTEGTQDESETGAFYRIPVYLEQPTAPAGSGPWMWQTTAGADVTIRDARLAAAFRDMTAGDFSYPTNPWYLRLWRSGNFIATLPIKSYDPATSTVVVTWEGSTVLLSQQAPNSTGSGSAKVSSYGLTNMAVLISAPGQSARSADESVVYIWPPSADSVVSIARRSAGIAIGAASYVAFRDMRIQRFANSGVVGEVGSAFPFGANLTAQGVMLSGIDLHQMSSGTGVGAGVALTSGIDRGLVDAVIERFKITQCVDSGTFRFAGRFDAAAGGGGQTLSQAQGLPAALTPARWDAVRAHPYGKIRWNFWDDYSSPGTCLLTTASDGVHVHGNFLRYQSAVHGNVFSFYSDVTGTNGIYGRGSYSLNIVCEFNTIIDSIRPLTISIGNANAWPIRNCLVSHNILMAKTGDLGGPSISVEDRGSRWDGNICVQVAGGAYSNVFYLGAPVDTMEVMNSLVAGIGTRLATPMKYKLTNNVSLLNILPANIEPDRVAINNTVVANPGPHSWDPFAAPIPAAWKASYPGNLGGLLPGQYGCFPSMAV